MLEILKAWCIECEKYVGGISGFIVKEYDDRLEVFCGKHGNGIQSNKCGSNCILVISRFPTQATLSNFKVLAEGKKLSQAPTFLICGFYF
jgi:hypothetical protein